MKADVALASPVNDVIHFSLSIYLFFLTVRAHLRFLETFKKN